MTGTDLSWVWLDGVETFERAKGVKAWKDWQASFPAAYLIEMVAQAGAVLLGAESHFEDDVVFTKIEGVEFLGRPQAGKRLEIEVEPENLRREGGWFLGKIFQDRNKILEGRVLLMNVGRLRPDGIGPITFPRQLVKMVGAGFKPAPPERDAIG